MDKPSFAEHYFLRHLAQSGAGFRILGNLPKDPDDWVAPWASRALGHFICDADLTPEQTFEVFDHIRNSICPEPGSPAHLDKVIRRLGEYDSCLSCAIQNDNIPAAQWILRNHPDQDLELPNGEGLRPLHQAALGSRKIAALLVEAGADVRAADEQGDTLFHYFAYRAWDSDFEALGHALRAKGLEPNLPNNEGQTPLHKCLSHGYEEAAFWLLKTFGLQACLGDPLLELRQCAITGHCHNAPQLIDEISRANADKLALESACDDPRMAHFGVLAQRLIDQGMLEVQGRKLNSLDDLADIAKKTPSQRPGGL